jgi:tetratricopeptide (TPR) repeat protein
MIPFREREGVRRKFLFLLFSCLLSVSLSAQTYQELSEKAVECVGKDSLVQAEDLLKQALKLEPKNAHNALLFSNLGLVQRKLGRYNDAVESYTYALNIAPLAVPILLNRAAIYLEQGMQDKAYVDYCQVMDVDKKNTEALLMRAYMHAGAMTPPNAAITGSIAFLGEDSSPWAISRLISSPTVKKNTTIRMSLISFSTVMSFGKWMSVPFPVRKRIWTLASSRLW